MWWYTCLKINQKSIVRISSVLFVYMPDLHCSRQSVYPQELSKCFGNEVYSTLIEFLDCRKCD